MEKIKRFIDCTVPVVTCTLVSLLLYNPRTQILESFAHIQIQRKTDRSSLV